MARKLVTLAEYGRIRGITRQAVHYRTVPQGGPIPVYKVNGKLHIDVDEANSIWDATVKPGRNSTAKPVEPDPVSQAASATADDTFDDPAIAATAAKAGPLAQAKMAQAVIKAQTDQIALQRLKGQLIDKPKALRQAFNYTRAIRDAWLNWPSRVGPELAAELGVDQHVLTTLLERYVREHLNELADETIDFG